MVVVAAETVEGSSTASATHSITIGKAIWFQAPFAYDGASVLVRIVVAFVALKAPVTALKKRRHGFDYVKVCIVVE